MAITNDKEFKAALEKLPTAQQRHVAALFVESVLSLCEDGRVKGAVSAAKRRDISNDELLAMHHAAKAASIESYTQCGKEVNWSSQASHFVAEAAADCVTTMPIELDNLAWNAAMHTRLAYMSGNIAKNQGSENDENRRQYQILEKFLQT